MRKIKDVNDYVSLQDIIQQAIDEQFPDRKCLFKLKLNAKPEQS